MSCPEGRQNGAGTGVMQDRSVGDISDYVKFAIARALVPDHRLGVAWWPKSVNPGRAMPTRGGNRARLSTAKCSEGCALANAVMLEDKHGSK